jgi:hypothetical protein
MGGGWAERMGGGRAFGGLPLAHATRACGTCEFRRSHKGLISSMDGFLLHRQQGGIPPVVVYKKGCSGWNRKRRRFDCRSNGASFSSPVPRCVEKFASDGRFPLDGVHERAGETWRKRLLPIGD